MKTHEGVQPEMAMQSLKVLHSLSFRDFSELAILGVFSKYFV